MQTFPVNFSRNPVIVWVLIIVPLIIAAACLTPLILVPKIPDWLLLTSVAVMMILNISVTLAIIKKWVTVPAEVQMNDQGLTIRLLRPSLFYSRRLYTSTWDGLSNVSTNIDSRNNRRFYLVSFRNPSTTVNLSPAETVGANTETAFGISLMNHVAAYNQTHAVQPEAAISQRGFYDSWWAKGLTILVYCGCAAAIIAYFMGSAALPGWRLIQLLSVSVIWLIAYHSNVRKAKRQ